jgi:hypothetical protein
MSVGNSGRIVIEVDTTLKQELYAALEREKLTLKEWFLRNAASYLSSTVQPSLFDAQHVRSKEVSV